MGGGSAGGGGRHCPPQAGEQLLSMRLSLLLLFPGGRHVAGALPRSAQLLMPALLCAPPLLCRRLRRRSSSCSVAPRSCLPWSAASPLPSSAWMERPSA